MDTMKSYYHVILTALMAILPLVFLTCTVDPITPLRLAVVSLALTAFFILTLNHKRSIMNTIPKPNSTLIFIALFAVYLIVNAVSVIGSITPSESIQPILTAIILGLLIYAFHITLNNRSQTWIATAISISAGIVSVIAILQYFDLAFLSIPGNVIPYSTMANKNLLASALFMILPCTAYTAFQRTKSQMITGLIATSLALYTIIISQTRAVWLALAVCLITGIMFTIFRRDIVIGAISPTARRLLFYSTTVVVILAIVTIASCQSKTQPPDSIINVNTASLNQRLLLWDKSIDIWKENPFTGCGIGNWKIEILRHGSEGLHSESGEIFFQRPHNDFLWTLAENGLIGGIAWFALIIFGIFAAFKQLIHPQSSQKKQWLLMAFLALIGFTVISFFSYPKERVFHTAMLALYLASTIHPVESSTSVQHRIGISLIAALVSLFCLIISLCLLRSDIHLHDMFESRSKSDWQAVIDSEQAAENWCNKLDHTSTPLAWYRGEAYLGLNEVDSALISYQDAYVINPYHIHVLNNLGAVYEMKGNHEEAIRFFSKALEVMPGFTETVINLAAAYFNNGEYEKAYSTLLSIEENEIENPRYEIYMQAIKEKLGKSELHR